jgi:hypothetical protein
MPNLCKYKNLFREPNTGLHKYRLLNIAIFDVLLTVIFAYCIAWFFEFSFFITLGILFLVGIVVHRLFCVRTTVDKLIFPTSI